MMRLESGPGQDVAGARALFKKTCAEGTAEACMALASALDEEPLVTPDDERFATWRDAVQRGCALGLPEACFRLGQAVLLGTRGIAQNTEQGLLRLEYACRNPPTACLSAAVWLEQHEKADEATDWFKRGCVLGGLDSCQAVAYRVMERKVHHPKTPLAAALLGYSCKRGLATACGSLAEILAKNDGRRDKVQEVLSTGCELDSKGKGAAMCLKAAQMQLALQPGAFGRSESDIKAQLEAACEAKVGDACVTLMTYTQGKLAPGTPPPTPVDVKELEEKARTRKSLDGLVLSQVSLAGAQLRGVSLKGAQLHYVDLSGADLSDANLEEALLSHCKLHKTNLAGATLRRTSFQSIDGFRVRFAGANLEGAIANGGSMYDSDFEGARLLNLSFDRFGLSGAQLQGTDLSGSILTGVQFREAQLAAARFTRCELKDASFERAVAPRAVFVEARLEGAQFMSAKLQEADFSRARAEQADFSEADLTNVRAAQAVFDGANFSNAVVCGFPVGSASIRFARYVADASPSSCWQLICRNNGHQNPCVQR
jgi:uncharacterized protein YjbI with pentapeptide repeats/TPR repeat protein